MRENNVRLEMVNESVVELENVQGFVYDLEDMENIVAVFDYVTDDHKEETLRVPIKEISSTTVNDDESLYDEFGEIKFINN